MALGFGTSFDSFQQPVNQRVHGLLVGFGPIIGDDAMAQHEFGGALDVFTGDVEPAVEHGENFSGECEVL
jgi:hypothetical protein